MLLALLGSGSCGGASRSSDGSGGESSTGGASRAWSAHRVTWDQYGIIDARFGIAGSWYTYNDCGASMRPAGLECTRVDPDLVGPDGTAGWSISPKQICMKGIVPQVERGPDMKLAFDSQWGAGMGFDLGNPYNAAAHGVIGFMFDVTEGTAGAPAPPTLRIGLELRSLEEESHFITITLPSLDQPVLFSEVQQGSWVMTPTRFTPDAIQTVKFDVYTNNQAPKPYDFCVSNFRVLM